MINNKDKMLNTIWVVISVSSLFVFFYLLYPRVILDLDDWSNITVLRLPFPFTNYWNPSRVFPEFFYPLSGFISSLIIKVFPAFGIIRTETLVTAIVLSALVFLYEYLFSVLLETKFNISSINSKLFSVIFILLHFLIFRSGKTDNLYLFLSTNIACTYYYLMPAIINSCMVIYLSINSPKLGINFKSFIIIICIYFSIFSNQFASIILVAFAFFSFLYNLRKCIMDGLSIRSFLGVNNVNILIGVFYILSLLADAFGGHGTYSSDGQNAVSNIFLIGVPPINEILSLMNHFFIALLLVSVVLLVIGCARKSFSKDHLYIIVMYCISGLLTFALLMLLCARVDPSYILRTEVFFGIGFYLICLTIIPISFCINKLPKSSYAAICLIVVLVLFNTTSRRTYKESNCENIDSKTCTAISEYFVKQVVDAQALGLKQVDVHVLESTQDPGSNWPQHFWLSEYGAKMLYMFGVTDNLMQVTIVPDSSLNEYFGIDSW